MSDASSLDHQYHRTESRLLRDEEMFARLLIGACSVKWSGAHEPYAHTRRDSLSSYDPSLSPGNLASCHQHVDTAASSAC
jgi:hypothetical protein